MARQLVSLDRFDELVRLLRCESYIRPAAKLQALLHETAWTSSSELIGELGAALLEFEYSEPHASPELRRCLDAAMKDVKRVWPDIR